MIAAAFLVAPRSHAQQIAPTPDSAVAPLDPAAPMAPLPDLGLAWPDLAVSVSPTPAAPTPAAPTPAAPTPASPTVAQPVAAPDRQLHYHVQLSGADALPADFRTRFNQLSALVAGQGKPANAAQIDRRARDDADLVRQLLRAVGRYDGTVATEVTADGASAVAVRMTVDPGQPYRFAGVTLPGLGAAGANAAGLRVDFPIKDGDPIDADAVNNAVIAFRVALGHRGYPFATVADPDIAVDHQTAKATLALAVTLGPAARFGRIVPTGPRQIFSAAHLATIARFHPGQRYDAERLDDFRRALIQTGLISAVTVTPVRTVDPGIVDIAVRIDRAPPRTIAGQLGYGTGEGVRAEVSWQHRNLIKPEGAVTFRAVAGTREQSLGATLRQNNFRLRDQVFTAQAVAAHTDLDAYDAKTLTLSAGIERQTNIIWQKKWTWSLGGEFVASDERDTIEATGQPRRRTFLVAALPSSLAYDGSDDLLNPTRGYRLAGRVSPEVSLQSGANVYIKLQIDGSAYQPIGGRVSIAGRFRFGSIQGASRDAIAPSRRFYAGGGGSVRGYGYQDIGPIDVNGDPVGGRALTEFSAEARIRFGNFGVVPFLDAGNLYSGTVPKVSGLRLGAGLGARYYSSFGPIRVDVGTPIRRRPGETRVAVYVSLGQAF